MSPVEVDAFFFLPLVLLLYWAGPRRRVWQNGVLLIASYVFFLTWSGRLLGLLLLTTGVNLMLARTLADRRRRGAPDAGTAMLFWLGVVLNLGELLLFKYAGFLAGAFGGGTPAFLALSASVGLSFRTLQNIGFLADVYLGRLEAPASLLDFAVFSTFFAQMLAGPIGRGGQLLPQYARPRHPEAAQWASGAGAFLLGFSLKSFAADVIGTRLVDPVFSGSAGYTAGAHWVALAGFALQVFADFAGYSLVAIGIGRAFGLELPQNFNFPFLSASLPELWRRWHITLNAWLFDYVFVPLTVSTRWLRGRMVPAYFITFGLSGLWHGASWPFLLWGILQAVGLTGHHLWEQQFRRLARQDRSWAARRASGWFLVGSWLLTQGFFVLTLVPFRAPTLAATAEYARRLLDSAGVESAYLGNPQLLAALALVIGYQLLPLRPVAAAWQRFLSLPPLVRGLAYGAAVVFLLVFTPVGSGTFIYAQF